MKKKLFIEAVIVIFMPLSVCAVSIPNHHDSAVHSPAMGLEVATKRFLLQVNASNQTQEQVANKLDRVVNDSAKNFETDRMTVALYLAKAGLPAAKNWINAQPKKAEELRQAINNQVHPEGTWIGHKPDWEIIKIALENGAHYQNIHGFGSAVRGAPKSFKEFIAAHSEFSRLPQLKD